MCERPRTQFMISNELLASNYTDFSPSFFFFLFLLFFYISLGPSNNLLNCTCSKCLYQQKMSKTKHHAILCPQNPCLLCSYISCLYFSKTILFKNCWQRCKMLELSLQNLGDCSRTFTPKKLFSLFITLFPKIHSQKHKSIPYSKTTIVTEYSKFVDFFIETRENYYLL